jgi:hypothetical protein
MKPPRLALLLAAGLPGLFAVSLFAQRGAAPADAGAPAATVPCLEIPPPNQPERAAGDSSLIWPKPKRPGAKLILDVHFLPGVGTGEFQDKIIGIANEWTPHSGVGFRKVDSAKAPIRIHIGPGGHWSFVGTEARDVPAEKPTMNLELSESSPAWDIRRVVLHEFGHALGLRHEHQSPERTFKWDEKEVMAYYRSAGWTDKMIIFNVLKTLDDPKNTLRVSEFDPLSIMLYPIPEAHSLGDYQVGWNLELSATDKKFIGELYSK